MNSNNDLNQTFEPPETRAGPPAQRCRESRSGGSAAHLDATVSIVAGNFRNFRAALMVRPCCARDDVNHLAAYPSPMEETGTSHTLNPFTLEERISVKDAEEIAKVTDRTIRNWCVRYGIGRRIAGGRWAVSKVALHMLLDGDLKALAVYRDNGLRRSYERVAKYYQRCGLANLLERPEFAA
jgi:hypothetical protein